MANEEHDQSQKGTVGADSPASIGYVRHVLLHVAPELLIVFLQGFGEGFSGNYEVVLDGLPHDVKLIDIGLKDEIHNSNLCPHTIILKLESKEFLKVKIGEKIPKLKPPLFKTNHKT